jgi:hypothetical protein
MIIRKGGIPIPPFCPAASTKIVFNGDLLEKEKLN